MRLFIAIYPSEAAVTAWQKFKASAPHPWPLAWTSPVNLHITLKFLGSVNRRLEDSLGETMDRIAHDQSNFELALAGGGVFPPKGPPSVFWAGVSETSPVLSTLAPRIDDECRALGFISEDRAYTPHVTVARLADKRRRVGAPMGRDFADWIAAFSSPPFTASELALVESKPGPVGSLYTVRRRFSFGGIHGR